MATYKRDSRGRFAGGGTSVSSRNSARIGRSQRTKGILAKRATRAITPARGGSVNAYGARSGKRFVSVSPPQRTPVVGKKVVGTFNSPRVTAVTKSPFSSTPGWSSKTGSGHSGSGYQIVRERPGQKFAD